MPGLVNVDLDYRTVFAIGLLAVGVIWYTKQQAGLIVDELTAPDGALNPVNDGNIANQAAESIWTKITGSEESPGADLYDLFHTGTIY